MPNWCECSLTVRGPKAALDTFKATLNTKEKDEKGEEFDVPFAFNQTVPRPKEEEENWYSWNIANWGTKWDACDPVVDEDDKKVNIHFQTAWAPPKEWMVTVSKKFPELTFEVACCECGMDYHGIITVINGEVDEDLNPLPKNWGNGDGEPKGKLKKFLEKHGIGVGG
jgi:hypothetical protein